MHGVGAGLTDRLDVAAGTLYGVARGNAEGDAARRKRENELLKHDLILVEFQTPHAPFAK